MKLCFRCQILKSDEEFHKSSLRKDGLQTYCKQCRRELDAVVYAKGGEDYKARKRVRQHRIANRNTRLIFDYLLTHPCIDCGESDPTVLDFDHVRGEKMYNIADLIRRYSSWATIKSEIDKCDVRCANCHRRVTAKRQSHKKYLLGQNLELD
jgi:hypothetical protein